MALPGGDITEKEVVFFGAYLTSSRETQEFGPFSHSLAAIATRQMLRLGELVEAAEEAGGKGTQPSLEDLQANAALIHVVDPDLDPKEPKLFHAMRKSLGHAQNELPLHAPIFINFGPQYEYERPGSPQTDTSPRIQLFHGIDPAGPDGEDSQDGRSFRERIQALYDLGSFIVITSRKSFAEFANGADGQQPTPAAVTALEKGGRKLTDLSMPSSAARRRTHSTPVHEPIKTRHTSK